jgi:hypothetical protein
MKALKAVLIVSLLAAVTVPSLGVVYTNDFACTRQTWMGSAGVGGYGMYNGNSNYSTIKYGRVAKVETDFSLFDFNRAAALSWMQSATGFTFTDPSQFAAAVTVKVFLTPYDDWDLGTAPPTPFGHYYLPAVRLSKGQDWVESQATFMSAATGAQWHDAAGSPMTNIYVNTWNTTANLVMNAASEQWGAADTLGGGIDYYVYDVPRPWQLDTTVAWAALKNSDAVGFQMVHDWANKPWAPDGDDCVGTIYGRLHGLTEYQPYMEVTVDSSKLQPSHTYLPADFNKDLKVSFADYLILEANFGKTNLDNAHGDANNDGKCSFADYLLLEAQFGHTTTPEPATIGLLILGGLGLLRRRSA